MIDISVLVLSVPTKADQSLTIIPAAKISHPRFMVAEHKGISKILANSFNSSTLVYGCTIPPLLLITQYVPTS